MNPKITRPVVPFREEKGSSAPAKEPVSGPAATPVAPAAPAASIGSASVDAVDLSSDLPVAVLKADGSETLGRFASIEEAEAFIAKLEKVDPAGVERGDYSIDAPEEMVQACRSGTKRDVPFFPPTWEDRQRNGDARPVWTFGGMAVAGPLLAKDFVKEDVGADFKHQDVVIKKLWMFAKAVLEDRMPVGHPHYHGVDDKGRHRITI